MSVVNLPRRAHPVRSSALYQCQTSTGSLLEEEEEQATISTAILDPSSALNDGPAVDDLLFLDDDHYKILRDLDGRPLSTEYLTDKILGSDKAKTVHFDSYTCPDSNGPFRGHMSDGCRVQLIPDGPTAFYKRVVFEDLPHCHEKQKTAPFKLSRDAKSYHVVASFLSSQACQQVCATTGVHIPQCYDAQFRPDYEEAIQSKFSFLLEDLSPDDGWYQQWLLHDPTEVRATLKTYAKMHAFFWDGSDFWKNKEAGQEFEEAMWPSGSYVQPQAQGYNQWKKVAREWKVKRAKFENISDMASKDYWDNLGQRLESVAVECGELAHPFADEKEEHDEDDTSLSESYRQYRTWTHGDPKSGNLFFRKRKEEEEDDDEVEVGLIDFQWSGFGLAATDLAHFLTSAIHADRLVDGGEETLMRYYYDELQKYLVEYGAYKSPKDVLQSFPYATFVEQYETAVLDGCRLIIAYTWDRFTEPVDRHDEEGCARTMNKTSYNKSVSNAVWLMSRCDNILKSRGV